MYHVFVRDGERAQGRLQTQAEANAWRCVWQGRSKRAAIQVAQQRPEQCANVFGKLYMVWEK